MPFAELFFAMRKGGLPVSLSEWMALMQALASGTVQPDLTDFYRVARAVLVKRETQYDTWDQVFEAVFGSDDLPTEAASQLLEWLENPLPVPELTPEQLAMMEQLPLDKLRELFEERLREQDERHDGGNKWIGTGGKSPFGNGGVNPGGVRVGGAGGGRSAVQIASQRRFAAYRSDRVLDTRSIAVALKKLRRLSRKEGELELDVDESIDETCRNAGELTLAFRPPRKNEARVLLLMDVGGSMDPYVHLVEKLFSAANGLNHWRKFEALSFHNCPYESLYPSEYGRGDSVPTADVLAERSPETFLIMVGDASMAPSELTSRNGAIDYWHRNETPGLVWLHRLRSRFKRAVWLNPTPPEWWSGWTVQLIGSLFPMFPLTLDGLDQAIATLRLRTPPPIPELDVRLMGGR